MIQTPLATNDLDSFATFYNRINYNENAYPSGSDVPKPIDLWNEKNFYGKINNNNNSIHLSEKYLKQIKTDENQPLFAVNFVVDAFEDLKKQFKLIQDYNKLENKSEFINLNAETSWKNLNTSYNSYMNILYLNFSNSFLKEKNRNEKIENFDSFIKILIEFIENITPSYPITKTAFIRSKYCSPEASGLMIQIKNENHSIDENKYLNFIKDPNFELYMKLCRKYGFLIDKNAPWRLIADLNSPAMEVYLKKYNIKNVNELFKNYYYESYKSDIDNLKVYISQFYNTLVLNEPYIFNYKTSINIKDETIQEKKLRKPINLKDLENIYDFRFWNKLYTFIRSKETSINWNQQQFETVVKNASQLEKNIDNQKSREYINRRFSELPDEDRKENLISFY